MIKEFVEKIEKEEYISNYLYEKVKEEDSSVIPEDFNLDMYNNEILDKMYFEEKEYFDNMYNGIDDNIHLDEEQCKAILADEKYSLIIAGAGTGKTTTMVSKVKYLVDKKNADPNRILVISYTRKATEEIAKRIGDYFGLPVYVTTFHSLGYDYLKQIFKSKKCVILDRNKRREINYKFFSKIYEDKNKIEEIINNFGPEDVGTNFVFSRYFIDNYKKYDTYDSFVDSYVKYKIEEAKTEGIDTKISEWKEREIKKDYSILSMRGECVKSAGEFTIANFLFTRGIDYEYEDVYDEIMERNTIYKPDFTVNYGGEKIYIEYYGMDDEKYNRIREWKRTFHKNRGNKYIEIDRMPLYKIEEEIDRKLSKYGVRYEQKSFEEIYEHIIRQNPIAMVFPFLNLLHECMNKRKESYFRNNNEKVQKYLESCSDKEKIQYKYISAYDRFYNKVAFGGNIYYFDFADLLYYSVKYLENITSNQELLFDYIIIDEYQDIAQIKYELTYKTAMRNDARVYAVGDDWQSIYVFSGSRIEYIYRFNDFFKGSKNYNITKTYRNSQELIDYTGEFIMRNSDQIKKQLISDKHIKKPIVIKEFDGSEISAIKDTIKEIHKNNPNHNILILARKNFQVERLLEDEEITDEIGSKITLKGYEDIQIDNMTMHKSKGLTYDEVIIQGLDKGFPTKDFPDHWYIELYKNHKIEEAIQDAEERRLFYVALTRTKNKVYLLKNKIQSNVSRFLLELEEIMEEKN